MKVETIGNTTYYICVICGYMMPADNIGYVQVAQHENTHAPDKMYDPLLATVSALSTKITALEKRVTTLELSQNKESTERIEGDE